MANAIYFPEQNFRYVAAEGEEDTVGQLYVKRTVTDDLAPVRCSCWKLTPEEMAEVARTGTIWASMYGIGAPPPLSIDGIKPEYI